MTPKEKANELVDRFRLNVLDYENNGLNSFKAKQCALIAVNEMIEHCNYANKWYWQEVKQEIEKL